MQRLICCSAVALVLASTSLGARLPQPFVVTLDAHSYVSYAPVHFAPAERLLIAPELRMSNCRRAAGAPLAPGDYRLHYGSGDDAVDAMGLEFQFQPTRAVMVSQFGDVICDGIALAGETGIARVFRGDFDVE